MRYTVINADSSREPYVSKIHQVMVGNQFVPTTAVDGRVRKELQDAARQHPYEIKTTYWTPKVGHIGVWYSMLNAWDHGGPLLHFEDDAVLHSDFRMLLARGIDELPRGADFWSLYTPPASRIRYQPSMYVSPVISRPYNNSGGVSMYFTEQGIDKIKRLVRKEGIWCQWDDWLYKMVSNYRLNGYVTAPELELVTIADVPSIAQSGLAYAG